METQPMKTTPIRIWKCACFSVFLAVSAPGVLLGQTAEKQSGRNSLSPGGTPMTTQAAFDLLKKLQGEWSGSVDTPGGAAHTVSFRLTAAGSTVMETQFAGTDHEMINMYHRDGADLRLTHYCAAGNQPQMKLRPASSKPRELVFEFVGGTNMNPETDLHIHGARITFIDDDHIESEWSSMQGKRAAERTKFVLTRKKV